jgi:hypothetical protein
MNDQASSSPSDLADDIIGVVSYEAPEPTKKKFLPWHRPRKQFVRHEQWRYQIEQLLNETHTAGQSLTYFGLPGVDMLDLRYFGTAVCEPRDLKLRFLGFNKAANPQDAEQIEFNVSFDEIRRTSSFDAQSDIVPDDLRQLVNEDSLAWQKTYELSPYDVINLDLCGGFGEEETGSIDQTYYNAVNKLLSIQTRKKSAWLLLITTRVDKRRIHDGTLARFAALYGGNLENCAPFQELSEKQFKIRSADSLMTAQNTALGVQSIFIVGLCKWLLGFALSQNPQSKMEVKSVMGYRVERKAEAIDMVSVAIRFDPTFGPLTDASSLSTIHTAKLDECDLATSALKRVSSLVDVDEYLSSQNEIKQEMIEAMCTLLEAARYDIDSYRKSVGT